MSKKMVSFDELEKPSKKKEGFLKKLKIKIDELFEAENLTFLGKEMMLLIYGTVSSVGLICLSSIGSAVTRLIWAFAELEGKCPKVFGAICGIGWTMFVFCFIATVSISVMEGSSVCDNNKSILELPKEEN